MDSEGARLVPAVPALLVVLVVLVVLVAMLVLLVLVLAMRGRVLARGRAVRHWQKPR